MMKNDSVGRYRTDIIIGSVLIVVAIITPFVFPTRYVIGQLTIFFLWATVVSQWNLVFGVAGIFSLAQMAISWVLRGDAITSALIGASKVQQVIDCVGALENLAFTPEELVEIDRYAVEGDINLWAGATNS